MSKGKSTKPKAKANINKKDNPGNDVKHKSLKFEDILYEKKDRIACVTINRPDMRNALRSKTREELAIAIEDAWVDDNIGVIVITGAAIRHSAQVVTSLGLLTPRRR